MESALEKKQEQATKEIAKFKEKITPDLKEDHDKVSKLHHEVGKEIRELRDIRDNITKTDAWPNPHQNIKEFIDKSNILSDQEKEQLNTELDAELQDLEYFQENRALRRVSAWTSDSHPD